ncbi:hypothetical protein E3P98_03269 [Wallemia ichthyophaga]|nr:hypothetical protein E3P98_03269 [Wallemia ichthyophaga]
MEVDGVDDVDVTQTIAPTTPTTPTIPTQLPGSIDINPANLQFSFISSYLLGTHPINTAGVSYINGLDNLNDLDDMNNFHSFLNIQLFGGVVWLLFHPLNTLIILITLSSIAFLHTPTSRTQVMAYLQAILRECEVSDVTTFNILTQPSLNTHKKTVVYDTLSRIQDTFSEHTQSLKHLVDNDKRVALEAMYTRNSTHSAQSSHSSQLGQVNHTNHPNNSPRNNHIPHHSTYITPRTSPTITYVHSPVNRAFEGCKGGKRASRDSRGIETEEGEKEHEVKDAHTDYNPERSLLEMHTGVVTQMGTQGRHRPRARAHSAVHNTYDAHSTTSATHSHPHPVKPPPHTVRQRAVSQQHLQLPSTSNLTPAAAAATASIPAPPLTRNSFGTPITHISPSPSPAASRKSSLVVCEGGEEGQVQQPQQSQQLPTQESEKSQQPQQAQESQVSQVSQPTTPPHLIKPSSIAQRRPKAVLSKTRLWELRQQVHDSRKVAVVTLVALRYTCKAEVYWRGVRGVVRDLARSLGRLNGVLLGGGGGRGDESGGNGGNSWSNTSGGNHAHTHTHTHTHSLTLASLRHLEEAYDTLFACYATGDYSLYRTAHRPLSHALRSYACGLDEVGGDGDLRGGKERKGGRDGDVTGKDRYDHASGLGIEFNTSNNSTIEKTHYSDAPSKDVDGMSSEKDDATDYLLDQTSADSLPRRGGDEVVFDGENVDVDVDVGQKLKSAFSPPDFLDRSSRMAGREVLDELMGILGGVGGVSGASSTTKLPVAEGTPAATAPANPYTPTPQDQDIEHIPSDPHAAKKAAQKALTSIVF